MGRDEVDREMKELAGTSMAVLDQVPDEVDDQAAYCRRDVLRISAVAIQGDGKMVAAGFTDVSGFDFALARYNTDGSLDTSFDADGLVTTDFGGPDGARAVAIQGNGKTVAAGFAGTDFALARYNTDGSLDATFSGDGRVTTDFGGGADGASGVAIQGDGKIVAAGFATISESGEDFAVARYTVCRRTSRPTSIPFCP